MAERRAQISLQPAVLRWARERAGFSQDELATKMRVRRERVQAWEQSGKISRAQAAGLARCTYTALGALYLKKPRTETLPITDFRRRGDSSRPSLNLLETVETMLWRQAWMRGDLIEKGAGALPFVDSCCAVMDSPRFSARSLRAALDLNRRWTEEGSGWTDALRLLQDRADAAGVLVVFNGVVGNNAHRPLDPEEFQGFALADPYAPLVFVNNADCKAAQMFTLAHELAHLLAGATGVSRLENLSPPSDATERFCHKVAAEFLMPASALKACWPAAERAYDALQFVAGRFKVSPLVAARCAWAAGLIDRATGHRFYRDASGRLPQPSASRAQAGGPFWRSQRERIGLRFGAAVAQAVQEGRLRYREAYGLTDLKGQTFDEMPTRFGIRL